MAQLPHEAVSMRQRVNHTGMLPASWPCHRQFTQHLHQVVPLT